jgi:hypothetical protein
MPSDVWKAAIGNRLGWAKNQFLEVHLEVFATDAVMGADQPLVEITNGRIRRRRHTRLRTLSNGFAKGWLRETCLNPASSSPASAQSGLRPANPRINFDLALQRLTGGVDHGTGFYSAS